MPRRSAAVLALVLGAGAVSAVAVTAQEETSGTGQLAQLKALVGTWTAEGAGFSTTLTYRWLIEGSVLEGANEVRGADGGVLARYRGMYAWDAGRSEIVFWTAAEGGEVHRGRAWWRDGVLWHVAEVSGGTITSYASAVRPADGRVEYFADYGTNRADDSLLRTEPLVYSPAIGDRPTKSRLSRGIRSPPPSGVTLRGSAMKSTI
jgi:hypothetical protein